MAVRVYAVVGPWGSVQFWEIKPMITHDLWVFALRAEYPSRTKTCYGYFPIRGMSGFQNDSVIDSIIWVMHFVCFKADVNSTVWLWMTSDKAVGVNQNLGTLKERPFGATLRTLGGNMQLRKWSRKISEGAGGPFGSKGRPVGDIISDMKSVTSCAFFFL